MKQNLNPDEEENKCEEQKASNHGDKVANNFLPTNMEEIEP
jgi:hypothetical protein